MVYLAAGEVIYPIRDGSGGLCRIMDSIGAIIKCKSVFLGCLVDNPLSQDMVYIFDSLQTLQLVYRDTINCRIDTVMAYLKTHKPYFVNKDSIVSLLRNATEGLMQYISLSAFHFSNDSATIKLILVFISL